MISLTSHTSVRNNQNANLENKITSFVAACRPRHAGVGLHQPTLFSDYCTLELGLRPEQWRTPDRIAAFFTCLVNLQACQGQRQPLLRNNPSSTSYLMSWPAPTLHWDYLADQNERNKQFARIRMRSPSCGKIGGDKNHRTKLMCGMNAKEGPSYSVSVCRTMPRGPPPTGTQQQGRGYSV